MTLPAISSDDAVVVEVAARQGAAALGRVIDTGARAAVLLGKRVLVGPIDPCGECDVCRRGGAAVCPLAVRRAPTPADAQHLVAAARWVVTLDDGLELPSPAGAAVAGDVAIAYTLYARTGPSPRDAVVIAGASSVSRFLVEILLAKGIHPTVIVDPTPTAWTEWLLARGVAIVATTERTSDTELRTRVAQTITAAHPGDTAAAPASGVGWRVIAAATDARAIGIAAAVAGFRATLTVVAPLEVDLPADLVAREVTVIGVAGAHPDLVVEVAAMCVKGEVDLLSGTTTSPDTAGTELRALLTVPS